MRPQLAVRYEMGLQIFGSSDTQLVATIIISVTTGADKHHNTAPRSATDQATKTDRMIISGESWKKAWQFSSAALALKLKNTAATAHLL